MALRYYENFLGIKMLNPEARKFVIRSLNFHWIFTILVWLTNTFLILYALKYVNLGELSLLITIQVFVQLIVDYPSGVLGDWIGHRWVLAFSAVFYCIGYLILSLPLFGMDHNFFSLLLAFVLLALALSQESGAFDSWFQNNYKEYAHEDSERRIFTELTAKKEVFLYGITAFTFFTSGVLILLLQGEEKVFLIQAFLFIIVLFLIVRVIINHPNVKRGESKNLNFRSYFGLLKDGFISIKQNEVLRIFIVGTAIFAAVGSIWLYLMLFPIYEEYSQSPDRVGLLRALIYVISAFSVFLFATYSKKIRNIKRWMAGLALMQSPAFFGIIYLVLFTYPIPRVFDWLPFIVVVLGFSLALMPYAFFQIMSARLFLDVIPDKNRNSVYSFIPTIISLTTIVALPIAGILIEELGYLNVLLILLIFGLIGSLFLAYAISLYEPVVREEEQLVDSILDPHHQFLAELQVIVPLSIPSTWKFGGKKAKKIWEVLVGTALTDGVISLEEQDLLVNIMENLQNYAKMLESASEDNIITTDEKAELIDARNMLWKDAHGVAIAKDGISDDENRILSKLIEIVQNLDPDHH
jgi:MFS family permease